MGERRVWQEGGLGGWEYSQTQLVFFHNKKSIFFSFL